MKYLFLIVLSALLFNMTSCSKNHSYPCPGLGQTTEADISQFDADGNLKSGSKKKKSNMVGRFNRDNGLINKKNPKQLSAKGRKRV